MIKMMAFFIGVSGVITVLTLFWQGAQPGVTTSTTAALTTTEVAAVGVNSTVGFKTSGGIIVIGNEVLKYTGITAAGGCPAPIPGSSPCFTGLTRAAGSIDAQAHATGVRVYDEFTGISNLSIQHDYTAFITANEQGSNVSFNPLTWKDAITSRTGNFIPAFLTGNWTPVKWIFIFFQGLLVLAVGLIMISIVRGVRLF